MGGVEPQMNWKRARNQQKLGNIFKTESKLRTIAGHNTHEDHGTHQQGGTIAMAFGQIAATVKETTTDPTGLGRWVTMRIQIEDGIKTRIAILYVPCNTERKNITATSVMAQQRRHLQYVMKDKRCPRQATREDFVKELKKWREQGERVIVFADANESARKGKLNKMMKELGMRESLSSRHSELEETKSWFRGKNQIQGIWLSPELRETSISLLPFGFTLGDHRGIMLDIPTALLVGGELPKIEQPSVRRLQSFNPKTRHKYISYLEQYLIFHRVLEKMHAMYSKGHLPGVITQQKLDDLDQTICEGMRAAESRCRKLCMGMVEFSPELNKLGKIWELWKKVCRLKRQPNSKINRGRIKRMAKAVQITRPLSETLQSASIKCAEARKAYLALKPISAEMRLAFLSDDENIALREREDEADKILDAMIKREESRATWRYINASRGVTRLQSVSEVRSIENGVEIIRTSKADVEEGIIAEVSKRFRLTEEWSPFRSGPLANQVGLLAEKKAVQEILNGTFHPSVQIDKHTSEMIKHLKIPDKIHRLGKIKTTFTMNDFQSHWKKAREKTSSSISGLHFGHYKAAATNDLISEIHALKVDLCINQGVALERWSKGLQVMLMKEASNYRVDKLRAILLIEADYNWATTTLISKRLLGRAAEAKEIPPEHFGGIKDSNPIDLATTRTLYWDVLRQRRCAGGVASVDASNCYDRVVHNFASTAAQKWGMPAAAMLSIFAAISAMQYHLRTAHGESKTSYGGTRSDPFQGLCQGNGGASGLWFCVCCVIAAYLKEQGHTTRNISPLTGALLILAALIYIDDTDLLDTDSTGSPNMENVITNLQKTINAWEGGLKVTGGALKPVKCSCQIVGFKFRDGKWSYKRPLTNPELKINGEDGQGHKIKYLHHDEAVEVVGVWQSPNGNNKDQIQSMVDTALEWSKSICNSGAPRNLNWISLKCCVWRSIAYSLAATKITENDNNRLVKALYANALPAMGVESSFPKLMKFTPSGFLGLGLLHPKVEGGIAKLIMWIRHASSQTTVGQWMRYSYEYLLLEINQPGCLFDADYEKWAFLATECWIKDLWRFTHKHNIRLTAPPSTKMRLQRKEDQYIIPWCSSMGANNPELEAINRYRMHIQVVSKADVTTGDGKSIIDEAKKPTTWKFPSNIKNWPASKTLRSDRTTWVAYLEKGTNHEGKLHIPLGEWTGYCHNKEQWRYSEETGKLYKSLGEEKWQLFSKQRLTPARKGTTFTRGELEALPNTTKKAIVRFYDNGTARFDGAANGPVMHKTLVEKNEWFVELANCWLLHHSTFPDDLDFANVRFLAAVCDGSFQPLLSTAIGAAAWILEARNKQKQCKGATAAPGLCKDSYRPELAGILTVLAALLYLCYRGNLHNCVVKVACDNDSALAKCLTASEYLPTNIPEADIIRAIYRIICYLREKFKVVIKTKEVEGHADKNTAWEDLSRTEQLNSMCDNAAKAYLREMVENGLTSTSRVPFEGWGVATTNGKVQGPIRKEIINSIFEPQAREYFIYKKRLTTLLFDLVNWKAIERGLDKASSTFKVWATKHVTGFCATTRRQFVLNKHPTGLCPSCGEAIEYPRHLPVCKNEEIQKVYSSKTRKLQLWLEDVDTDPIVISTIITFMETHGEATFILPSNDIDLRPFGRLSEQAEIGYDNFMTGMTAKVLEDHQREYYQVIGSNRSATIWASDLAIQLLKISHACWLKRNRLLHGNSIDFLPAEQFAKLNTRIVNEYRKGTDGLPKKDHHLFHEGINATLERRTPEKQSWLHTVMLARSSRGGTRKETNKVRQEAES